MSDRLVIAVDARPLAVVGNGVSRLVSELVRSLRDRDDLKLLLLSHRPAHPLHDLAGLEMHVDSTWSRVPGTLWLLLRMNAMAKQLGAHLVWGTGHILPPRTRGLRRVVSVHDLVHMVMPESMRPLHRQLSRVLVNRSIRTADAVIALSRTTAFDTERLLGVDPSKITTILPGNCLEDAACAAEAPSLPARYLFALGSLEPRKNIDGLLAAFEELTKTQPDLHLVLTGLHRWKAEAIMTALDKPSLKSRVVLTGYLTDAQISGCMSGAEAFLIASHYEGFGLPILEAAGKTRILLADTPVFREISGYLRDTTLIDFRNAAGAARLMGAALDSERVAATIAPIWREELRWDTAALRHADVFKRAMNTGSR